MKPTDESAGRIEPVVMSGIEAEYIKRRCHDGNWSEIKKEFPKFHSFIERLPHSHNNGERPIESFFPEIYADLCRWAKNHLKTEMSIWKDMLSRT